MPNIVTLPHDLISFSNHFEIMWALGKPWHENYELFPSLTTKESSQSPSSSTWKHCKGIRRNVAWEVVKLKLKCTLKNTWHKCVQTWGKDATKSQLQFLKHYEEKRDLPCNKTQKGTLKRWHWIRKLKYLGMAFKITWMPKEKSVVVIFERSWALGSNWGCCLFKEVHVIGRLYLLMDVLSHSPTC